MFEVQQEFTYGWENVWHLPDSDDLQMYHTLEEARLDILDHIEAVQYAVAQGYMDSGYDVQDFRIVDMNTGEIFHIARTTTINLFGKEFNMTKTIKLEERPKAYGRTLYLPACETSRAFCELLSHETLTPDDVKIIKKLDYHIERVVKTDDGKYVKVGEL